MTATAPRTKETVPRPRATDVRLIPVAAVTWAGAAASVVAPAAAWVIAAASVAVALGVVWRATRSREPWRTVLALSAVALACAGAAAGTVALSAAARDGPAQVMLSAGSVEMTVHVTGKVERWGTAWGFDAVVSSLSRPATEASGVPVRVILDAVPDGLDVGSSAQIEGRARPAEPGSREVVLVQGRVIESRSSPAGVLAAASDLRAGLRAVTSTLPEPGAGLVSGLAVGDTSGVSAELDDQMRTASLSHLTAVSGANCALVVGVAFGVAALLGAGRVLRVVVALAALAGFVVLVTPEPSVVRAAVMAVLAMTGVLLGRIGVGVALLSAGAIGVLIVDPWMALSLGFALSVVATGALLLGAGPLADGMSRVMPRGLALAIAVPLSAQLACAPLIALISPDVALYAVAANLVAAPAAPIATMVGLAACLLAGVPVIGVGLAGLAWVPAAWIAATAEFFAQAPGALIPWWEGPAGLAGLVVVGAGVFAVVSGKGRRLGAAALVLVAAAVMGVGPVLGWWDRLRVPAQWSVVACDVGQGDAVLLRSAGVTALVDVGPDAAALDRCLTRFGVERIDLLMLSHFDLDHVAGLDAVRGRVTSVIHGTPASESDNALIDALVADGSQALRVEAGAAGRLGNAQWQVLWPRDARATGNDGSVVLQVAGGGIPSIVMLGDLSAEPQTRLLARAPNVDIVKVAHHGSADQDADLYSALTPALALISVGENTYGHPRAETLDALTAAGAAVARTDLAGDVALWLEGDSIRLWRSMPP